MTGPGQFFEASQQIIGTAQATGTAKLPETGFIAVDFVFQPCRFEAAQGATLRLLAVWCTGNQEE